MIQSRTKLEEQHKAVDDELLELKQFLSKPPESAKKNLKSKSQGAVDSMIGMMEVKFKAEQKKSVLLKEAMDDVYYDSQQLAVLLKE